MYTAIEASNESLKRDTLMEEEVKLETGLAVRYSLYTEDGASRAAYGTACERMYSIRIRLLEHTTVADECFLTDVARSEEEARSLLALLSAARVTPCTAADIVADLLAD